MNLFIKLFLLVFAVVIVASGINPPPVSSEWLIADCIVAALIGTLIVKRLSPRLYPADEEFEFDVVADDEHEELSK